MPWVALQAGLKPGGFFVLKENIAKNGKILKFTALKMPLYPQKTHYTFSSSFLLGAPCPKMMCRCVGFVVDKGDSSITRSDTYFRDLFKQTGFHLYKTRVSSSTFHVCEQSM